ncbi:hypothetical protein [Planococcus versutus]|uniref:Uncharacterized protein n=1 Tax=Planococcus versutus TaxID=1302659 RepID=A0A1B1S5V0_9BACL|nr:hypothetical protein [Planococcus versutus]ANU28568.1 hypothetical protein I858_016430 [Planococcus versutus]
MAVFSHNYTLGLIKEVGEEDVLVSVNGKDIEIELKESDREVLLHMVTENVFLVPVDSDTNELILNTEESVLREEFPEMELAELQGAADEIDEE